MLRNTRFFIANQQDVPDIGVTDSGSLYTIRELDPDAKQNYSVTIVAENLSEVGIFQVSRYTSAAQYTLINKLYSRYNTI